MIGNKSYVSDYEEIDGGFVAFRGDPKGGRITGKGKISTGKLDFKDVYFIKELKFNLISVSQMCDKKNSVLFTDTECVVLSPNFKLLGENHVLLRVPRKDNMYSVDLKNIVPSGGLTCLFAKATLDESNLWHRRLGHINFKTMNKLVRGNLVRGLPSKIFLNNHKCVAFQKGKQHKASCKTKTVSSINQPLQMLHMDLFRPTFVKSLMKKMYCLVVTDDYSIENLIDLKLKVIRCDNRTEFKNKVMNQFCEMKGRKPALSFMRPFGCPVTILNTLDHLGNGPNWLFDIDALTISMNYKPLVAGNQTNKNAGTKENFDASQDGKKIVPNQECILLPLLTSDPSLSKSSKDSPNVRFKPSGKEEKMDSEHPKNEDSKVPNTEEPRVKQEHDANVNRTNNINIVYPIVNAADIINNDVDENIVYGCIDDLNMPNLEEIVYSDDDEEVGTEADMNNLATTVLISPIPTTRVHKDHPLKQIIGDIHSAPQTKRMTKNVTEHEGHGVLNGCTKTRKMIEVLWLETKARLVAQDYTQGEGIDYDEVFALVARIEAIRIFLAYASFMNFIVYQMDVKSAFLYGIIEEEVYVWQSPGFEDPEFPNKVYKVEKALYGLHQAFRAWYETLSTYLLENRFRRWTIDKTLFIKKDKDDILLVQVYVDDMIFGSTKKSLCTEFEQMMHKRFQMSSMGELTFFLWLQVKQKDDGIFINQDKYVADILKKFDFATVKTASTPMETNKALLKDEEAVNVDVHLYKSMIGSLMYLTASRPDIMFVVCTYARFQVTPKTSHLHAVKRIFRYLKGHPKLGLWYPRDSPFDLEAFSDSDYAGASLDRKSTTGGYLEWNGTAAKDEFQVSVVRVTYYWQVYLMLLVAFNIVVKIKNVEPIKEKWKLAETHNLVAFLEKPEESNGFEGIIDFLNASSINYALTVNPIVYESCIQQFWAIAKAKTVNGECQIQTLVDKKKVIITEKSVRSDLMLEDAEGTECLLNDFWATAKAKTVNGERQIQALVDKKKVIITEKSVRSDLMLEDAEGTECLPNDVIFEQLTLMGAKTTAWNEFSSTMASAIILFLDKQVEGMSKHKGIYVTPSHTKKIFANMKREGKGFSRRITPLFQTMMVQAPKDMGKDSAAPTDNNRLSSSPILPDQCGPTEPIPDEATNEKLISTPSCDPPQSGEDRLQLTKLINLCTKLQKQVLDLEEAKTAQAKEIASLKMLGF
ncbi:putative ribonuclease H-like domain-containing protein [Tanacetum coccineum]